MNYLASTSRRLRKALPWVTTALAAALLGGCGDGVECGEGTVALDGACVASDAAPVFSAIEVTNLRVRYDTSLPIYLGHRLPIQLALRADSPALLDTPRPVAVNVSLIEHYVGEPTDEVLAQLAQCDVATLHYDLAGGGTTEYFEPILELPEECLRDGRTSVDYDIMVLVDTDERAMGPDARRTYMFTEWVNAREPNPDCRTSFEDDAAPDGCLHVLHVEPSPGTDIEETVVPNGNVALFWKAAEGSEEAQRAMLTVEINRRAFGHDPYDVMDPDSGEEGDRNLLVCIITHRVRIAPASGPHAGEFRHLEVDNEEGETLSNPTWSRLTANSDNDYAFDLFPTQEVLDLVEAGDWRTEEEFVVEVCLDPSFTERGEVGASSAADPLSANNCDRFSVLGVRARPPAQAASELGASTSLSRNIGNNIVGVNVGFESTSRVRVGAASTNTVGFVDLASDRLPRMRLGHAQASAVVDLIAPSTSGLSLSLDVFGSRVQTFERKVPTQSERYGDDWSYMQRRCVSSRFQIGPVPLSVEGCAQGSVGFEFDIGAAYGDGIEGERAFPSADAEGQILAQAKPYFSVGATLSVAIDVAIARAGVEGSLTLFDYSLPSSGSLNVGFVAADPVFDGTPSAAARLNLHVDQDVRGPYGRISLFADLRGVKICKARWFPYPCGLTWNRVATVPLFTFGSARDRRVIYDFTTPDRVLN